MIKSKLPNNVLGKIWKLADVDKDGKFGRQGRMPVKEIVPSFNFFHIL
jgi:hypothetical protein